MIRNVAIDQRAASRYMISIPVRAEWDDTDSGERVVTDGATENVGPGSALVHLQQLPDVGSRIRLLVIDEGGTRLQVVAEVLRVERNPAQPLAALQLLDATDEWRGLVWEPAARQASDESNGEDEDADFAH
ncbi:MAG: PilZ domain-containing protein [Pyrinomonadaceae bacterium]|nr:PilZ domain-containing protein [Pyrinomonadaceae bacterium]